MRSTSIGILGGALKRRGLALSAVILLLSFIPPLAFGEESDQVSLPKNIGVSWSYVLHHLIPDYEKLVEETRAHGGVVGEGIPDAGAKLEDFLETDLGRKGWRYLLIRVGGDWRNCEGGCFTTYLAMINLRTKRFVWEFHEDGWMDDEPLRVFRVLAKPELLCFSFQHSTGSRGGFGTTQEHWMQARQTKKGGLSFYEIVSFVTESWNGGNRGGSEFETTGEMNPDPDGRTYRYVRKTKYTGCFIEEVDSYRVSDGILQLQDKTASREDGEEDGVFPFDLETRTQSDYWVTSSSGGRFSTPFASGDGRYVAERVSHRYSNDDLSIRSLAGGPSRLIEMKYGDAFRGTIDALGWAADSSRVFAVVSFGDDDRALLSFSVTGDDDYWEETLSGRESKLEDGFVLKAHHESLADPPD